MVAGNIGGSALPRKLISSTYNGRSSYSECARGPGMSDWKGEKRKKKKKKKSSIYAAWYQSTNGSGIPPTRSDNHNRVRDHCQDGKCDRWGRRLSGDAIAAALYVFSLFANVNSNKQRLSPTSALITRLISRSADRSTKLFPLTLSFSCLFSFSFYLIWLKLL